MSSTKLKYLKAKNRISILESRQPMKDNYNIVQKLKRLVRRLEKDL